MRVRYFHRRNPFDGYNDADLCVNLPQRDELDRFEESLGEAIEDALTRTDHSGKHFQIERYGRHDKKLGRLGALPFARAVTICIIEDDDRNELTRGYAFCSPEDQFNRRVGRMIAYGRALAGLAPGELREEVVREEHVRRQVQRQESYQGALLDRMFESFNGNMESLTEEEKQELAAVLDDERMVAEGADNPAPIDAGEARIDR